MTIKRAYIEITNQCNLHCTFCVNHNRPSKYMSLEQFKFIANQVLLITPHLYLHVQGEPLLHPYLDQILDYCDLKKAKVQLVTNGSLLDRHPDLLNHSSLRKISISLHSLDFQDKNIQDFLNPILSLIDQIPLKKERFLELRFWTMNHLGKKSSQALEFLKNKYSFTPTKKKLSFQLKNQVFINFDEKFEWPTVRNNNSAYGTCIGGKSMIAILSDGTLTPCCLDCNGEINFGNILDTPLNELLHSSKFNSFITELKNNKLIEPLCQKCTYRNRFY